MCDLWKETEDKVRNLLQSMPDVHRVKFRAIAEQDFPTLVKAAQDYKARFHQETQTGEKNRVAARYERIYRLLARLVSLRLLGVPVSTLQGQVDEFLGLKKVPDSTSITTEPAYEVGHNEETYLNR